MNPKEQKKLKSNWFVNNIRTVIFLFFLFWMSVLFLIVHQRYQLTKETREKDLNEKLDLIALKLNQFINASRNVTLAVALSADENYSVEKFNTLTQQLLKDNPTINAVQLQPQGIVKFSFPKIEKAMNLDLFKSNLRNKIEAEKTIQKRDLYFQGPFNLVQGGMGLVGRLPLFINNKFWGFSAIVVTLDDFLKLIKPEDSLPEFYHLQLTKTNPVSLKEEYFFEGNRNIHQSVYNVKVITDGNWKIYLADTRHIFVDNQLLLTLFLGLIYCFVSVYLLYMVLYKQKQLVALVSRQDELIKTAEGKYKIIFENAAIGIAKVNSVTGYFVEANPFLCKLLGYSLEELKTLKIKSLIQADDLQEDTIQFKQFKNKEIDQYSAIRRYMTKSGKIVWTVATVSAIDDIGEDRVCHIKIINDITRQRHYENELLTTKQHLEELINSVEGVLWEADISKGFECTFISNKIVDLLGFTPEETIRAPNLSRVFEEDKERLIHYFQTELLKKKYHINEYRAVRKDNKIIWIRDIVTIEPNLENPKFVRGLMLDITTVKETQEALESSYQVVAEQNKRLHQFAYIVSHNFRSHASNIDGIINLLNLSENQGEQKQLMEMLVKVASNLNNTIYNLNNLTNIRANVDIENEYLNLQMFVDNTIQLLKNQISEKSAQIINEIPSDVYISFTSAYLESVLLNLLSNALRYASPDRRPVINVRGTKVEDAYLLSVIDNGIGIDLERFNGKIFGINQTFHENRDARGLGLFITKSQIEGMGGSITVQSTLGIGTTFNVFFRD